MKAFFIFCPNVIDSSGKTVLKCIQDHRADFCSLCWPCRNPNHLWPEVSAGLSQLTIGQHAPQVPAWHPRSDQPSYEHGHQQQNPS